MRSYATISLFLSFTTSILAKPQYSSSSPSATSIAPVSATSGAYASVYTVSVGGSGLSFSPDSLNANAGDIIEFRISSGHDVAQSTFDGPCAPSGENAVYSGFPPEKDVFSVTLNNTDPMWLYCSVSSHCQNGMAMVINPPASGNTIEEYKSAAANVQSSTAPENVSGGLFGPAVVPDESDTGSSSTTGSASPAATTDSGAGSLVANVMFFAGALTAVLALVLP